MIIYTVPRDLNPQWRKMSWSPDCSLLAIAHSNGKVSFYDLLASNVFNIPPVCSLKYFIVFSSI